MSTANPSHPTNPFYIKTGPALGLILLSFLLMLPRLLSAQFGLLDDGNTLAAAQEILKGQWTMEFDLAAGRLRPVYWLYHTLIYALAGANPFWFFFGNALMLAVLALLVRQAIRAAGGSERQSWITAGLFVLSSPVIENFYTLSKAEHLQLIWILLALLLVASRASFAVRLLGASALLLIANLTKETSLAMLPISTGWLLLAWIGSRRFQLGTKILRWSGTVLVTSVLAAGLFFLLRTQFQRYSLIGGTYTNSYLLDLGAIATSVIRWTGWIIRDFAFLLPLLLLVAWIGISRKRIPQAPLLLAALVWMTGWMVVFLPWEFTLEYYMLPFGLGAVILAGLAIEETLQLMKAAGSGKQAVPAVLLTFAGVLWLATLANNVTNARIQLAVDRENEKMLAQAAQDIPQGGSLYINIQDPNEYYRMIGMHLATIYNRPDIRLQPFQGEVTAAPAYVASPFIRNQIRLSVRMGVYEPTMQQWNSSLEGYLSARQAELIHQSTSRFPLVNIDLPRLVCPLMSGRAYCAEPEPIVDTETFEYGWNTYQVLSSTAGQ